MYDRLSSKHNEIRLCVLQPGRWDDIIHVSLKTVSLDDSPDYMAVSYVWGDASLVTHMLVDERVTAITSSLHKVLRRIRNDLPSAPPLWVDALCINQLDDAEKSTQIALMGRIYKATRECLLWLGEVNDEPIEPFQGFIKPHATDVRSIEEMVQNLHLETPKLLQNIAIATEPIDVPRAFEIVELFAQGKHLYEMPFYIVQPFGNVELRQDWAKVIYSLSNVLKRAWWRRIWTAQEGFLPSQAHIRVGPHSMPFDTFLEAAKAWHGHVWSHNVLCCVSIEKLWMGGVNADLKATIDRLADISALSEDRKRSRIAGAHSIYLLSVNRQASKCHDHVYGAWGLAGEFFRLNQLPDYTLDPAQVYASTTLELMEQAGNLCMLPYARPQQRGDHAQTLPSWTPDWSRPAWDDYFDICNYGAFKADKLSNYRGARRGKFVLKLEGFPVYTVSKVGRRIEDMNTHPRNFVPIIEEWLQLADEGGHSARTVWDVIHNATHEEIGLEIVNIQTAWWAVLKSCAENKTSLAEVKRFAKSGRFSLCAASMGWLDKRAIFYTRLADRPANEGRTPNPAVTLGETHAPSRGSIGLSLPGVQAEDQIFIVKGARAPLIVRPIQDSVSRALALQNGMSVEELDQCYTFVGVSYVHGLMQGQAVSRLSEWTTLYIV